MSAAKSVKKNINNDVAENDVAENDVAENDVADDMTNLVTKGVLYTSYGDVYVDQAIQSAKSVKAHCQDKSIQTALFTDKQLPDKDYGVFDHVIIINLIPTDFNQYMLNRLLSLPNTPFTYTLALDADTLVLSDISDVFPILDKFDIGMTHGHNRQKRYIKALESGNADPLIPYSFGPVQGGLMLYKRCDKVDKYLYDLIELYKQKNYYDDQVSMRELLWNSELRLYMLPREYNFCNLNYLKAMTSGKGIEYVGEQCIPKILHYSFEKRFGIQRLREALSELTLPNSFD